MKVAVVGMGPSGAMAAWAAIQYGHDVIGFDRNPESISIGKNHGIFSLWDDCDLFLSQKSQVKTGIIGARGLKADEINQEYAYKVYRDINQPVSIFKYAQSRLVMESYNHAEAYQQIVDILGKDRIKEYKVDGLESILWLLDDYDIVINTLPADYLWPEKEWPFIYAYIYHADAPPQDSFMIYNVNQYIPWYRCSAIFSKFSMEYRDCPESERMFVRVKKVIDAPQNPNDLVPKEVWCVGRFGAWDKETLTEDVYWQCLRRFSDLNAIRPTVEGVRATV